MNEAVESEWGVGPIRTYKCACWVLNNMGNFLIGSDRWLVGLLASGLVPLSGEAP